MKKFDLLMYVGNKVHVFLYDGSILYGVLGYVYDFSSKYDYRKPNYFYIDNISFRASYVLKVTL